MMETFSRTISRSAPASATPPTSACWMADKKSEQDEGHHNRKQRQRRAEFLPPQVAPDEVEKFHFTGSVAELRPC